MNVRNFVKERRAALGWKQEYLSRHSCVGRSTISNIETGRYIPGVDIALLLAGALSCTVEDLFELEERRTL